MSPKGCSRNTFIALLCSIVFACGTADELAFSTPVEFQVARGIAYCNWKARCGWIARAELDGCKAQIRTSPQFYKNVYGLYEDAVEKGLAIFDTAAAHACINLWQQTGCTANEVHRTQDACFAESVLRGQLRSGADCTTNTECADGLCFAGGKRISDAGCMGTCASYLATSMPCDPANSLCQPTTDFCDPVKLRCTPKRPLGSLCIGHIGCQDGLRCVGPSDKGTMAEPNECQARGGIGMPCGVESQSADDVLWIDLGRGSSCQLGLFCNLDKYLCEARHSEGELCSQQSACQDGLVCNGLHLDLKNPSKPKAPGHCAAIADFAEPCNETAGPGCANTNGCDPLKQQCLRTELTIGGPCSPTDWPCPSFSFCDQATDLCTPLKALGDACTLPGPKDREPCFEGECSAVTQRCELMCS